MKTKALIALLVLIIAASSCTVQSLHPLYDEQTAIYESFLEGEWIDSDSNSWIIEKALGANHSNLDKELISPKMYQVKTEAKKDHVEFLDVYLVKLGENYFIDVFPESKFEDKISDFVLAENILPVHFFSKVVLEGDSLFLYQFDSDWLEDLIKNNQIKIAHEKVRVHDSDRIVLTASTKELQKFVTKYQNDKRAFQDPDKLYRKH